MNMNENLRQRLDFYRKICYTLFTGKNFAKLKLCEVFVSVKYDFPLAWILLPSAHIISAPVLSAVCVIRIL